MEYLQSSMIGLLLLVLLYATTETVMGSTDAEMFFKSCKFKKPLPYGSNSFKALIGNIRTKYYKQPTEVDLKNQIVTLTKGSIFYDYYSYMKFDFKNHKRSYIINREFCKMTPDKEYTKELSKDLVLPPLFPFKAQVLYGTNIVNGVKHFLNSKYDYYKTQVDLNNQIVTLRGETPVYSDYYYIKIDFKRHKLFYRMYKQICYKKDGEVYTKDIAKDLVLPPSFPPKDSIPCGKKEAILGMDHFFYSKKYDFWYNINRNGHSSCKVVDINLPGEMKIKPTCDKPTNEKPDH